MIEMHYGNLEMWELGNFVFAAQNPLRNSLLEEYLINFSKRLPTQTNDIQFNLICIEQFNNRTLSRFNSTLFLRVRMNYLEGMKYMFSQYDDIMSVEDVMEALSIGRSKLYELLRSGQIKSWKMKGYRIPKAAVQEFVLAQTKMSMERFREFG